MPRQSYADAMIAAGCPGFAFGLVLGVLLSAPGCDDVHLPPGQGQRLDMVLADDDDALQHQLDEVLEYTLRQRSLNTEDHAAWQILHGVLAYQRGFPLRIGRAGATVSAVDYLLQGGKMAGWQMEPGDVLDPKSGRRGLRAVMQPGSKAGQGHADQWFAVLAQCGLPPQQTIRVGDVTYTMADYVAQVQRDLPRNIDREWSWTLIGLTAYLPTTASWTAGDGSRWSIRRLVQLEAEQEIPGSTCGGTHRLIGLAMALNQHLAQRGKVEGPWKLAEDKIQWGIDRARRLQNPDGSFSTNYFAREGRSPDLADDIRTTGHTLELLAIAMTEQQLAQPWVRRAALRLCDAFRKTKQMPLECGALYHAAHGLVLYRQRRFGPRTYATARNSATPPHGGGKADTRGQSLPSQQGDEPASAP